MKRTTIILPDELAALVEHESRLRDVSTAEIVRDALQYYFDQNRDQSNSLGFIGLGRSGRSNVARTSEEILDEEWGLRDHDRNR